MSWSLKRDVALFFLATTVTRIRSGCLRVTVLHKAFALPAPANNVLLTAHGARAIVRCVSAATNGTSALLVLGSTLVIDFLVN